MSEPILFYTGDEHVLVDGDTGEICGIPGAPGVADDIEEILCWLGPRRTREEARIVGLKAERDALLTKIDEHYGPLIKHRESTLEWIENRYGAILRDYTRDVLAGRKARSFRHQGSLLTLGFRVSSEKFTLVKEKIGDALKWCKNFCPDAVKVEETILISKIDDRLKEHIRNGIMASFEYTPPSDTFYIK